MSRVKPHDEGIMEIRAYKARARGRPIFCKCPRMRALHYIKNYQKFLLLQDELYKVNF